MVAGEAMTDPITIPFPRPKWHTDVFRYQEDPRYRRPQALVMGRTLLQLSGTPLYGKVENVWAEVCYGRIGAPVQRALDLTWAPLVEAMRR